MKACSWTPAAHDRVRDLLARLARHRDALGNEAAHLLPELAERERALPRERTSSGRRRGESLSAMKKRVRAEVKERDGGRCCARGWNGRCLGMLQMDHFYGRGKREEAPETLWHLCARHHQLKTDGWPGRVAWLELYRLHCQRHGYREEVERLVGMVALERAQHPIVAEVAAP
jgi:hypothetical protein